MNSGVSLGKEERRIFANVNTGVDDGCRHAQIDVLAEQTSATG